MRNKSVKRLKKHLTLLLCIALCAHPATAFAVEDQAAVSSDIAVSSDFAVTLDEAVSSDAAVSGDAAGVPEDTAEVSQDTVAISEDQAAEVFSYEEDIAALNDILASAAVYAVIMNSEGASLYVSPDEGSAVKAKLPCANTVLLQKAVYEGGKLRFKVSSYVGDREFDGYVKRQDFVCIDPDFCEWENGASGLEESSVGIMSTGGSKLYSSDILESQAQESFDNFPSSYRDKLSTLHSAHPNWVFVPQTHSVTTLDDAVNGEYADRNRNWIAKSAPDSYKEGQADSRGYWYYA